MSDDQEAWPLLQAADRLANEVLRPLLGERSMVAIPAARAVVDALRADPEFAAAVLGGDIEWAVEGWRTAPLTRAQARELADAVDRPARARATGQWITQPKP